MGNFDWLRGPVEEGRQGFQGRDLLEWMSFNLEWDIVVRLAEISSSRQEHVVVPRIASVCVGPERIKGWRQSWRVLSNSGVTFELVLLVEEMAPQILQVQMTKHPSLLFPTVDPERTLAVRDRILTKLYEATADVAGLELRGRLYDFRPHPLWSPLTPMRRRLAKPMVRIGELQAVHNRTGRSFPVFLRGVHVAPVATETEEAIRS